MSNYEADLIIVGGGPAGCAAALAATETGAKVLLLEEAPFPGGMATGARVHSMLTFHGLKGQKIIGGIPERIIKRLKAAGGTPGHISDTVGVAWSVTPTDPDVLSAILHVMLKEAGVHLILEGRFLEPVIRSGRIEEVRGVHRGGFFTARAPVYLDTTGEGQLGALSGCPFESGREGKAMPATLIFEAAGVELARTVQYALDHREEFHFQTRYDQLKSSPAPGFSGFFSLWREASLTAPRDRLLFYSSVKQGCVGINSTRIAPFEPLDPHCVTEARLEGIRQVLEIFEFLKTKVPGFEKSVLSSVAPFLGIRESRRLRGQYVLTGKDVASGRRFKDEVALGGFPIDIHQPDGAGIEGKDPGGNGYYGIPYRCLVADKIQNLLMAGKCFSADFDAHASARVQATSMAMGQAAGIAGAISAKEGKNPASLDPALIRETILHQGGILNPDENEEELP